MLDAEHGIDEGSRAGDVPKVGQHFLFEIGPCFPMIGFVDDGPVGRGPAGDAEEGGRSVGVGDLVGPVHGVFHTVNAGAPVDDGQGIFVGFAVEHRNFLLIDLHHWILGGGDWGDGKTST